MAKIIDIINQIFKDHKYLKILLAPFVFIIIIIFTWIGMCIGGGQD